MPHKKSKIKKACQNCGETMYLAPWQVARNQRFCSPKCASEGKKGVSNFKLAKPKVKKICEYCGDVFEVHPYRADTAHHCSRSCYASSRKGKDTPNWKGGKLKKVCLNCGIEYLTWRHLDKISQFCSKSCHSSYKMQGDKSNFWNGGKKSITCLYCGKEFQVNPNDTRRKYCSKECHDNARKKRIILTCVNCGKEYEEKKSRANRYDRSYCSHACYTEYAVGEKSHQWRGGLSFEPYPPTFNRKFKRLIRERDNYTCVICSKHGDNVHHIDYVKENTTPENCITLCRSCHTKTHHNRSYWQEYFTNVYSLQTSE